MKLILAQGNIGVQYTSTRHNVGWQILDALSVEQGTNGYKAKPKFICAMDELIIGTEKVILAKPSTYYNETGICARSIRDFYQIAAKDVLVIYDDLALNFGTIRTRFSGSDAGNNGIKSLNSHLGDEYWRLRVGILNDLRSRMPDADFVLSQFSAAEKESLEKDIIPRALVHINNFLAGTIENTSSKPETTLAA